MVAMFLYMLAHDVKNRKIQREFVRSAIDERMHRYEVAMFQDDNDEGDLICTTIGCDDINYIEASNKWSQWRDDLAKSMFNECMASLLRNLKHPWTKAEESCGLGQYKWRSNNETFRPSYLSQLKCRDRHTVASIGTTGLSASLWRRASSTVRLGKDRATGAHAETFADIESNVLGGSKGIQLEDGLDMEFPTMCSSTMNMSPESMMGTRPSRSSDARTSFSG
ncbi:retrotransposon protein [Cucumis melo var. makuwa]|uniref:Retrotransposon protein n=1 Tax=Cucumis melo var. makuwa TaxID=1194695 RepID=A0A5A7T3D0_CUCMM|nr:retrotransposon protein [Cucumis melo var. makuwa]